MPKLELDENHIYRLDGRRIIGTTEALKILDDRRKVDPFYLERGSFIHKATEYDDQDELDFDTVDDQIKPYLGAYAKFKRDTGFDPQFIETIFYHPKYLFAGKIDRIGMLNKNLIILDLKSGTMTDIDKLQLAAYWELVNVNHIIATKAFALYLKDDGNYSLVEVEKPKLLLPVFLAALKIAQWKENL